MMKMRMRRKEEGRREKRTKRLIIKSNKFQSLNPTTCNFLGAPFEAVRVHTAKGVLPDDNQAQGGMDQGVHLRPTRHLLWILGQHVQLTGFNNYYIYVPNNRYI